MEQPESSEGGKYVGKEKKTRRRLRLSCVECTKRRQKCDRHHPCSLCVTRGVAHLCRWETVPLARPTPARPPTSALREASPSGKELIISELRQQITSLERELECTRNQRSSPAMALSSGSRTLSTPPTDIGTNGTFSSPNSSEISSRQSPAEPLTDYSMAQVEDPGPSLSTLSFTLHDDDYESTSTLAQLSLAHHGEFIGRGSLICALHSITARRTPRFLYAKSTDAMSGYREPIQKFSSMPFIGSIEELLPNIPSRAIIETLTGAFFAEVNWRYGIPEDWFRGALSQMWVKLQHREVDGWQINANWLILLFAILASAPQHGYAEVQQLLPRCSDDYFMCSMMARRLAEDEYLNVPNASLMVSAADGTVLGCLATPLLCNYLAERGRISEAWKLAGHSIRNAEAVGMHRDPEWKLWQMMSGDEKLLRRRAWWGLFISDKTFSYTLGRPQVLRREIYDVGYFSPLNPDGSRNLFNVGQNVLVSLMELFGEAFEKCFSVIYPDCHVFLDMDHKFQQWEEQVPSSYQRDYDIRLLQDLSSTDMKLLIRQRYIIHTWYLVGRLKLHIASTTGQGRPPQPPMYIRQCMERCVLLSFEIIHYQTAAYSSLTRYRDDGFESSYPGSCWLFEGCFSLFEASVALYTTLAQYPWQEKVADAKSAIDSALNVFNDVARREHGKTGETATRAIEVLITIREHHWSEANHSFHLPKIKDDPDPVEPSNGLNMNNTMPEILQFTFSCMRQNESAHTAAFADLGGYNRQNGGLSDHLETLRNAHTER